MPRCGEHPKQPVGRSRGYSLVSGASSLLAALEILTTIPRFVAYKGNNHMPTVYMEYSIISIIYVWLYITNILRLSEAYCALWFHQTWLGNPRTQWKSSEIVYNLQYIKKQLGETHHTRKRSETSNCRERLVA